MNTNICKRSENRQTEGGTYPVKPVWPWTRLHLNNSSFKAIQQVAVWSRLCSAVRTVWAAVSGGSGPGCFPQTPLSDGCLPSLKMAACWNSSPCPHQLKAAFLAADPGSADSVGGASHSELQSWAGEPTPPEHRPPPPLRSGRISSYTFLWPQTCC